MLADAKQLFCLDALRQHLEAFNPPAQVVAFRPKLMHWAELLASPRANTLKE